MIVIPLTPPLPTFDAPTLDRQYTSNTHHWSSYLPPYTLFFKAQTCEQHASVDNIKRQDNAKLGEIVRIKIPPAFIFSSRDVWFSSHLPFPFLCRLDDFPTLLLTLIQFEFNVGQVFYLSIPDEGRIMNQCARNETQRGYFTSGNVSLERSRLGRNLSWLISFQARRYIFQRELSFQAISLKQIPYLVCDHIISRAKVI